MFNMHMVGPNGESRVVSLDHDAARELHERLTEHLGGMEASRGSSDRPKIKNYANGKSVTVDFGDSFGEVKMPWQAAMRFAIELEIASNICPATMAMALVNNGDIRLADELASEVERVKAPTIRETKLNEQLGRIAESTLFKVMGLR